MGDGSLIVPVTVHKIKAFRGAMGVQRPEITSRTQVYTLQFINDQPRDFGSDQISSIFAKSIKNTKIQNSSFESSDSE